MKKDDQNNKKDVGNGNNSDISPDFDFSKFPATDKEKSILLSDMGSDASDLTQLVKPKEITAYDLLKRDVKEIPFLVKPLLPKTGIVALAGTSDVGKSTLLRQLAIAIATGQETFLGFEIKTTHQSVIYVSTEDDENAIATLLRKQQNSLQREQSKYEGLRLSLIHI